MSHQKRGQKTNRAIAAAIGIITIMPSALSGCSPANAERGNLDDSKIEAILTDAVSIVRAAKKARDDALKEMHELNEHVTRVNDKLIAAQAGKEAIIEKYEAIKPRLVAARQHRTRLEHDIEALRARYSALRCEREDLLQQVQDRQSECDQARGALDTARDDVRRLEEKLAEVDTYSSTSTEDLVQLLLNERRAGRVLEAISAMEADSVLRRMMPALSTPGIWAPGPMGSYQYQGHFLNDETYGSLDAVPHSLSRITAKNALQPTRKGLYALYSIAADPEDKMRPRWTNAYRAFGANNGVWMGLQAKPCFLNDLRKLQGFLREYGRDLVTAGLLAP